MNHGDVEGLKYGIKRSPEWPKVEKEFLLSEPNCKVCGLSHPVQVHHILPYHYCVALGRRDLELNPKNLITLCESEMGFPTEDHHLYIGHLGDFKSSNLNVLNDALRFQGMSKEFLTENASWKAEEVSRLKSLDKMTDEDKTNFINLMSTLYPL